MKKYQYLASWDDQTLTRVGDPVVVLGDSNVSQVEVTMPSNFLLDPTGAVARMYFLLPGEKESDFETLDTATQDENGDYHVTWTIKHVHSQKGGRLAFSLALIGDDAQWDSRTAIIPVYESRYQPEREEAEEPYTGRLTALEGSMASIRGEFTEVQEDFEELKETATLGTPIPESLTANMQEGRVYIYTGTESGYTAGHVYYYVNGSLTDGGVYGGTAVDATLTQSGQAADAAVTGAEISAIKEDLSAITVAEEPIYIGGWEQGSLSGDGGAEILGTTRCRTADYVLASDLSVSPTPTLTVKAGYKVSLREYTRMSVATYVWGSPWFEGENTIELVKGHYYRFVTMKTTAETLKPEDVPADIAIITTGAHTDVSLTQYGKAADAGATGDILRNQNLDIIKRNGYVDTIVKLQQLKRPTRIASRALGAEPLSLLWFSDIHGDQRCLQNIMDFYNYYSDSIDGILHTGDSVTSKSENGMDFWNNVSGTEIILNTIGNHDTRVGNVWIGQTMAESYTQYFATHISNWGVSYTEGLTYYYKDYTTPGVRLIVLDCMHQTSEQLAWFIATLASANTAGYHVLVAVHGRPHWLFSPYDTPWDDAPVVPRYGDEGYTDKSGTSYPENLSDSYASAVDDFIADGGTFIAWLHGHMHLKMFAMLETHPNQLDVSVANAGGTDFAWTYVWARIPDTRSEDDFNVLAVDTVSKMLRIAKFGVNYDRYMRHVDTISYDYGNRTLIYSN